LPRGPIDDSLDLSERFEEVVMPRLFTALEVPRDAALSLSLLRGGLPGARWVDSENYHITLRFFGDVEGHVADEIANALDRVRRPAFTISLSGVGVFGGRKPHALWAGVSASPDLFALQAEIERKCQRLGFPPIRANSSRMSPSPGSRMSARTRSRPISPRAATSRACPSGFRASC
jgi:hypothetical protein